MFRRMVPFNRKATSLILSKYSRNYCLIEQQNGRPYSTIWTAQQYPDKVRNKAFAKVEQTDLSFFESVIGKTRVLNDADELESYNTDWMKMYRGQSSVILKPKTTEEVCEILKYCNKRVLAVCPQGGKTGLVGGSVPVFDEIIISMSLMNQIVKLDEFSGVLECESGCILEILDNYVRDRGFIIPLDLGAKGSCQIGGNVSTSAGGLRLLRYGSMHANVLGLEIVLANGKVLDCMSTMKKDNTGYDLKQLFIGAEGTLGIVTKVAIQCPPKPESQTLAFLGTASFEQVLKTFKIAKEMLSEVLSSFELMDYAAIECVERFYKISPPIAKNSFYMIIEVSGSNKSHDEEKLSAFLEKVITDGSIVDGTLATSSTQMKNFWSLRESITPSLQLEGFVYKYDISLPLNNFYEIVGLTQKHLADCDVSRCCGFGHLGDGNLHLNITTPSYCQKFERTIESWLYEYIRLHKGSVSAEHGIGIRKVNAMNMFKTGDVLEAMKQIKICFDPNGILNPYKCIPN